MPSKYQLQKSRENWKKKAICNGKNARYEKKETKRVKKDRDKYKSEAREARKDRDKYKSETREVIKDRDKYKSEACEARKELEKERQNNKVSVPDKQELVYITLTLFLVARISFRGVSRVLEVLSRHLGLTKAPSTQTVINWVTRLSITKMHNPAYLNCPLIDKSNFSNGFVWIIDISIGLGSGKIFTILGLNLKHHALNEGAPTLKDVHCIAVAVAESWTGETIAAFLQKVIAVTGRPAAYLKDGGTDLAKGVRLIGERGLGSVVIDDISHIIANLFKHEYQNHPMFDKFISACGKVSKKLKQTVLAFLAPPKNSTKARFMNLQRLIIWADKLLKHSPTGRVAKDSILSKLRAGMGNLPQCKTFITRFLRDAQVLLKCQKILKVKGLSKETYNQCKVVLGAIPARSIIRTGFIKWLDQHLEIAQTLGLEELGLPSSSDILESLFGIAKQHGTGNTKDANRIALRIPALCGEITRDDAQRVLDITVKEQQEVESAINSLTKQRRSILPNPGSINDGIIAGIENLELIPKSQKWEKKSIKYNISDCYKNSTRQELSSQNKDCIPYVSDSQRAFAA